MRQRDIQNKIKVVINQLRRERKRAQDMEDFCIDAEERLLQINEDVTLLRKERQLNQELMAGRRGKLGGRRRPKVDGCPTCNPENYKALSHGPGI